MGYDPSADALRKAFYEILDKEYKSEIQDAIGDMAGTIRSALSRLSEIKEDLASKVRLIDTLLDEAEHRRRREMAMLVRLETLVQRLELHA